MIKRAFTDHPASVGETYFEHLRMAYGFGSKMVICGAACIIHAILPFLFKTTARQCICDLHDRLVVNRCKKSGMDDELPTLDAGAQHAQAAE